MKKNALCTIVSVVCLLPACGPKGGAGTSASGPYKLTGVSQKGPFAIGSSVSVQTLGSDLSPTGDVYLGSTSDDLGNFSISKEIPNQFVEVVIDGYFFDEVAGSLSTGTITLRSVSDISEGPVKVNLMTSLQAQRIRTLVEGGSSFAEARTQSKQETLTSLGIPTDLVSEEFDKLDISQTGNGNAALLATSAVFMKSAHLTGDPSSELASLVSTFVTDFGSDGKIDSVSLKTKLKNGNKGLLMDKVRGNLSARFSDLGVSVTLPDFEGFVDSDGDGTINSKGSIPYTGFAIKEISTIDVTAANLAHYSRGLKVLKVLNDVCYIFYSSQDVAVPSVVKAFDFATQSWSTITSPSTFLPASALATYNNKLYSFGGGNSSTQGSTNAEVYDPATNSWLTLASAPIGIGLGGSAFAIGNVIFIVTGEFYEQSGYRRTVEVLSYTPSTDTWATLQSFTRTNSNFDRAGGSSAAVLNGKIYLIGGVLDPNKVDRYDPATNQWNQVASTSIGRYSTYLYVAGGKLFAIGGTYGSHDPLKNLWDDRIEIYDPSDNTWGVSVNVPATSFSYYMSFDSWNGKIYFTQPQYSGDGAINGLGTIGEKFFEMTP